MQSFRIRSLQSWMRPKRAELVDQYQQLLYDEMPLVVIYHGYGFSVQSDRLQGYNGFEGNMNNQAVWRWSVTE